MLKEIISKLDYSDYDEIALVLFGMSFLAICIGAFMLRQDASRAFGRIPLDDLVPVSRTANSQKTSIENKESNLYGNGDRQ